MAKSVSIIRVKQILGTNFGKYFNG
jgi:hypothetical protein